MQNVKSMDENKRNFYKISAQTQGKIFLKIRAGARRNAIDGELEIGEKKYLKISIMAVPEKGKANKMIIDFLAKEWGVAKKNLEIVAGKTSQYKVLVYIE